MWLATLWLQLSRVGEGLRLQTCSERLGAASKWLCKPRVCLKVDCTLSRLGSGGSGAAGPGGVPDLLSASLADGKLAPELIACLSATGISPPSPSDQLLSPKSDPKCHHQLRSQRAPVPAQDQPENPAWSKTGAEAGLPVTRAPPAGRLMHRVRGRRDTGRHAPGAQSCPPQAET